MSVEILQVVCLAPASQSNRLIKGVSIGGCSDHRLTTTNMIHLMGALARHTHSNMRTSANQGLGECSDGCPRNGGKAGQRWHHALIPWLGPRDPENTKQFFRWGMNIHLDRPSKGLFHFEHCF